ncbi:hypothetical protein [Microvirga puerhi]|uniref:Uncharacterized protein n=1 Tax=Microvirga puerhi TaxID=2876078 RepID=A0ABS7VRR1_9HYPH|nr:hypothetical protein [Microvirga puerhi]MBZ6078246.1 hypothetical protein [Microvirga puerhi]
MPSTKTKPLSTRSRLRHEPPTLDEAIFAAQGLADGIEGQTQIAAMLMGLPEDEVRAAILKAAPAVSIPRQIPRVSQLGPRRRVVVVEKRAPRVLVR